MSFLDHSDLSKIGFRAFGKRCQIDNTVIFINPERIQLGDDVRIDAFCLLNAGDGSIELGKMVHIASHVRLVGGGGIYFGLGSGASSGASIFSQSDDFTEGFLAHPTVPARLRRITVARVEIGPLAIIGANSVILPGVSMGTGAVLGALSLLKNSVPRLEVHGGIPARKIGNRDEAEFLSNASMLGVK
jgi:galactoside O-acetyltransferase